jgi:hypothetical protein
MYLGVHSGILREIFVALHELATGFFVETALWEGYDQQAFDDLEDVGQGPITRVPVLLQGVHTDLTTGYCNVRMENLSQEVTYTDIVKMSVEGEYGLYLWVVSVGTHFQQQAYI